VRRWADLDERRLFKVGRTVPGDDPQLGRRTGRIQQHAQTADRTGMHTGSVPKKRKQPHKPRRVQRSKVGAPKLLGESVISGFFSSELRWTDPLFAVEQQRQGRPVDDLIGIADHLNDQPVAVSEQLPFFALTELTRATKTLRSVCLLVRSGYGPQALVLARTIFESALSVVWALKHPEDTDKRIDYHRRLALTVEAEAWKQSGIAKLDSSPKPPLSATERAQAEKWFGKRGTGQWSGHKSLQEFVKAVVDSQIDDAGVMNSAGLWFSFAFTLMLGWADRMTHTTGIATWNSMLPVPDGAVVGEFSNGPSKHDLTQALMLGADAYTVVLDALLPLLNPSLVPDLEAAGARRWRSLKEIDRLTSMKPDDPCICDRPQGAWAECHGPTDEFADHELEQRALADFRRAQRTARTAAGTVQ